MLKSRRVGAGEILPLSRELSAIDCDGPLDLSKVVPEDRHVVIARDGEVLV